MSDIGSDIPVEETPGYLGHLFDEFIVFDDGLKPLEGFDFRRYAGLADELDSLTRQLEIDFGDGPKTINFDAYSIHEIVASIPFVDAIYDCPPDQGPAAGAGHIFVLDEDRTLAEATASAKILRSALDADLAALQAEFGEDYP
ncbi:MAG: hypothetical protein K2Q27_05525 [Novosphingobium sp.]|nr:hypothetical protein [Novosphingobium sp.]